jgi:hypothetical protein
MQNYWGTAAIGTDNRTVLIPVKQKARHATEPLLGESALDHLRTSWPNISERLISEATQTHDSPGRLLLPEAARTVVIEFSHSLGQQPTISIAKIMTAELLLAVGWRTLVSI